MAINWNQPPSDIVKDLIGAQNPKFITAGAALGIRNPGSYPNNPPKNSKIEVYPIDTDNYEGVVEVHYRRLAFWEYLQGKFGDTAITVTWGDVAERPVFDASVDTAVLLGYVNGICGLQLAASDVNITVTPGTNIMEVNVAATATNVIMLPGYSGNITFEFPAEKTATSDVVTTTELDGLVAPTMS